MHASQQGHQGGTVAPPPQPQATETHVATPAVQVQDPNQAPVQQQPAAQPQPVAQPQGESQQTQGHVPGEQIHHLPGSAFRRIKDEAAQKGKQEALEELAQANGYDSVEAMQEALQGAKSKPKRRAPVQRKRPVASTQAAAAPSDGDGESGAGFGMTHEEYRQNQREMRLMQKRLEKQNMTSAEMSEQLKKANAMNRRLKAERDAKEVEMLVREAAVREGVRDVDYAMRLMTREQGTKSEEELAKFNVGEYFAGLRESHSYLFNEVSRPATTGNGAGAAQGSPPTPGAAQQGAAQGGKVDARQMSPDELRKHLAARGLSLSI